MKINDVVYGGEEITEEILIELINSKEIQRLLLRRLNASLDEQVAGLLHDISHTAFSHVVDWIFGDPIKEDFQDLSHLKKIREGEVGNILRKYGYAPEKIADLKSYSLLEQEIPLVCADRLDYALREMIYFESRDRIKLIINSIKNVSGKIVFDNIESAVIFAEAFAKCQKELWAAPIPRIRYYLLSSALKKAMDDEVITEEDFEKTDIEVINVLQSKGSAEVLNFLNLLRNGFSYREEKGGIALVKKFRYVNPLVIHDGRTDKLGDISQNYKDSLSRQKKEADKIFEVVIE